MAAAVCTKSEEPDQFRDKFDLESVLESSDPAVQSVVKSFLETIDTVFEDESESKKAERWLEWASSSKYLKCVRSTIPDVILPKNCSGELTDVKVFSKRGPDDHIYDTQKMIRERVARGNSFLHITRGPHTGLRCILYALKKFTGGLGDDDDRDKVDDVTWRKYFIKPINETKRIIATRKANGEAAHLSCIQIDGQYFLCAGSKNVHMLIRGREDIQLYKGERYKIASEVCDSIMDCLDEMEPWKKDRLLRFLVMTRFTAVFEILSPLHQHVEDLSSLKKAVVKFITWTKTELEPAPENMLCTVSPHIGIEIARALGLQTIKYDIILLRDLEDRMRRIREGYQYEGEVLYFLDDADSVIGMLKKKTAWYIICRAIREKVRNSCASMIKRKGIFSISKSEKQIQKRLDEIQSWLGLSNDVISDWKNVGVAFLRWSVKEVELGHLSMEDIADRFPVIWKRHLAASGLSDRITFECKTESLHIFDDDRQYSSSQDSS